MTKSKVKRKPKKQVTKTPKKDPNVKVASDISNNYRNPKKNKH
jgi:hypothetical protein